MSPHEEYSQRLQQRESRVAHHQRLHIRLGNARLALFLTAAAMAWASLFRHYFSAWWLGLPLVLFVALAVYHSRVLRQQTCAKRAVSVYKNGIARLEDRWAGLGETGERFYDPHHIYAGDLDLFGKGSLFELLSTARTRIGEETLANWLLSSATLDEVSARHAAIDDLRDRLDFREDLAVMGEDARTGVHPDQLLQWARRPVAPAQPALRAIAVVMAIASITSAILWGVKGIATPFIALVVVEGAITYAIRRRTEQVTHGAEHAFADLNLLAEILERVEREPVSSPELLALQQNLRHQAMPAFRAIAKLSTLVDFVMSRDNLFVRVFDLPLLYSVQVTLAVEAWQRQFGHEVQGWLASVGEMEALLSLATYRYERPEDVYPETANEDACFDAEELGHPLLPASRAVRNSLRMGGTTRTLLVSGSNMSGKSTLLRSVGIAAVMAMAGAPVRARRLLISRLQVGASIRVNDSLQEGESRFYAEIKRLRAIVDLAGQNPPLLFLLDELLQGTNSADRRVGAEGLLRALVERGAVGLVTTHDLALTEVAGPLDGRLRNVHFQDELEGGKIRFDYKLREGIVTKSNGLELMRSIGLDV